MKIAYNSAYVQIETVNFTFTQQTIIEYFYTVSQKKLCHFYFYRNFGKCWSILKILLLLESDRSS